MIQYPVTSIVVYTVRFSAHYIILPHQKETNVVCILPLHILIIEIRINSFVCTLYLICISHSNELLILIINKNSIGFNRSAATNFVWSLSKRKRMVRWIYLIFPCGLLRWTERHSIHWCISCDVTCHPIGCAYRSLKHSLKGSMA